MHPRTIADSVDPLVWLGLNVAESWYGPNFATDFAGIHTHHEGDKDLSIEEQQAELLDDEVASMALQFIVIGDTSVTTVLQDEETTHVAEKTNQSEETTKLDEQLSSIVTQPESVQEASKSSTNVLGFVGIGIVIIGGLLALGFHKHRNSRNVILKVFQFYIVEHAVTIL